MTTESDDDRRKRLWEAAQKREADFYNEHILSGNFPPEDLEEWMRLDAEADRLKAEWHAGLRS